MGINAKTDASLNAVEKRKTAVDKTGSPARFVRMHAEPAKRLDFHKGLRSIELVSCARLRGFAARLVSVQEVERERIAREIHDEFGQQLTGLNFDLAWMEKQVADSRIEARGQWIEKVANMRRQIEVTIQTVQRIATQLRPCILDLGLLPALECKSREFQASTGIACEIRCTGIRVELNSASCLALFRIFQEALTNVARHAQACCVRASLAQNHDNVRLLIKDDGIGFSPRQQKRQKCFGLMRMKERALLVGGSLSINSLPGRGTTVLVEVPFGRKCHAA